MRPKKYNTPHRSRVVKTLRYEPSRVYPASHTSFEELTPTLLREFVEKIIVHECSYDENGTRRQDIEIYYSFVGKVDLPEA